MGVYRVIKHAHTHVLKLKKKKKKQGNSHERLLLHFLQPLKERILQLLNSWTFNVFHHGNRAHESQVNVPGPLGPAPRSEEHSVIEASLQNSGCICLQALMPFFPPANGCEWMLTRWQPRSWTTINTHSLLSWYCDTAGPKRFCQ